MKLLLELSGNEVAQTSASERAFATLVRFAEHYKNHPGKLASLMLVLAEEIELSGNKEAAAEMRAVIEPKFGRYVAKATN